MSCEQCDGGNPLCDCAETDLVVQERTRAMLDYVRSEVKRLQRCGSCSSGIHRTLKEILKKLEKIAAGGAS